MTDKSELIQLEKNCTKTPSFTIEESRDPVYDAQVVVCLNPFFKSRVM